MFKNIIKKKYFFYSLTKKTELSSINYKNKKYKKIYSPSLRNSRLKIFPTIDFGNSGTISIILGYL